MSHFLFILLVLCNFYVINSRKRDANYDSITEYKFQKNERGPYTYKFSTGEGFKKEETAELLNQGTKFESIFLRGSYEYPGSDGKIYRVKYIADDNGFHPEGDHFEVPLYVPWPSRTDETAESIESSTVKVPSRILLTPQPKKYIPNTTLNPTLNSEFSEKKSVVTPNPSEFSFIPGVTNKYIPTRKEYFELSPNVRYEGEPVQEEVNNEISENEEVVFVNRRKFGDRISKRRSVKNFKNRRGRKV